MDNFGGSISSIRSTGCLGVASMAMHTIPALSKPSFDTQNGDRYFSPSLHCSPSSSAEALPEDLQNPRVAPRSIDIYTVQCDKCSKWRVISTEEEYEKIRSKMKESPYVWDRKLGISCDDLADIEYNATRTWAIDRPGILKTPEGFKRSLELRRDFSRMDVYYITPTGKKLRTLNEITTFIEANLKYQDVKLFAFSFTFPKKML